MAATIVSWKVLTAAPGGEFISQIKLSGLTAGLPEQILHRGPSGCTPFSVQMLVTEPPTDGSLMDMVWDDTDTTNDKVEVRFRCPAGGSLDGATATLLVRFLDQASGGQSTITTT
jgi:hypothetical protein